MVDSQSPMFEGGTLARRTGLTTLPTMRLNRRSRMVATTGSRVGLGGGADSLELGDIVVLLALLVSPLLMLVSKDDSLLGEAVEAMDDGMSESEMLSEVEEAVTSDVDEMT